MRHWLLMFRPETYEIAQKHGLFGVLYMHRKRFNQIHEGDKFISYISRKRLIDGHGTVESSVFEDPSPIGAGWNVYPLRAKARFEQVGAARDGKLALWGLSMCQKIKTEPTNYLLCMGGFAEIPVEDYEWLRRVVDLGEEGVRERIVE